MCRKFLFLFKKKEEKSARGVLLVTMKERELDLGLT